MVCSVDDVWVFYVGFMVCMGFFFLMYGGYCLIGGIGIILLDEGICLFNLFDGLDI